MIIKLLTATVSLNLAFMVRNFTNTPLEALLFVCVLLSVSGVTLYSAVSCGEIRLSRRIKYNKYNQTNEVK